MKPLGRALAIALALALGLALTPLFLSPDSISRAEESDTPAPSRSPAVVALPAPAIDGEVSIEASLAQRRTLRNPADGPVTLREAGQLCWAAQGVTDDKGHRTAPSARASYPLGLLVLAARVTGLEPGLYRYSPAEHGLAPVALGNQLAAFEEKAVGQGWTARVPVIFVITGRAEAVAHMGERGVPFMWVEAGLAAQGLFLQATALGLGGTYVGGYDAEAASAALGLPPGEQVLGVLPIGRRP